LFFVICYLLFVICYLLFIILFYYFMFDSSTRPNTVGNIMYAPAYSGAYFGNMSVGYGQLVDPNIECTEALTSFSGYTGAYYLFPEDGYVEHYPLITSNPTNSSFTKRDTVVQRFYFFYENDLFFEVQSNPDVSPISSMGFSSYYFFFPFSFSFFFLPFFFPFFAFFTFFPPFSPFFPPFFLFFPSFFPVLFPPPFFLVSFF
jgi:hypothetical protein